MHGRGEGWKAVGFILSPNGILYYLTEFLPFHTEIVSSLLLLGLLA